MVSRAALARPHGHAIAAVDQLVHAGSLGLGVTAISGLSFQCGDALKEHQCGLFLLNHHVASASSIPGSLMSMSTTSGRNLCASVTALSPLADSPTTLWRLGFSSEILNPVRTIGCSSTINTNEIASASQEVSIDCKK